MKVEVMSAMNVRSFYGTRASRYARHLRFITSRDVPDDGNVSETCDDSDNSDTESETVRPALPGGEAAVAESETESSSSDSDDDNFVPTSGWSTAYKGCSVPAQFLRDEGPLMVLTPDAKAVEYFGLLFPTSIWKSLVDETNRYAQQKGKQFEPTAEAEMNAFIGMCMAMNIHNLPHINSYWSGHWVLSVPQFAQVFTKNRFWFLRSNLHLVDNNKGLPRDDPNHDKLFKIRPLLEKLNDTFGEGYEPHQEISVDESMVRFKGRSSMKQYMPMKPIKRGFKIWCASCSCCGYLLKFQMYTGKELSQSAERGLAHRVVTDLILPRFAHKNYIVFMDNFFTSIALFDELQKNGVQACGTYRTNRTGFPRDLTTKQNLKQLKRGDFLTRHRGNMTALVWMDRKPVYVVSNAHLPTSGMIARKNPDGSYVQVKCPDIVAQYNCHMGGVDLLDQLKSYYCYDRKSKRWWLRLFFHLLDLCVVNAFILYKHCYNINFHPPLVYRPKKQLAFRTELIDQLVNHFTCRRQSGPVATPVVSLVPSGHKIVDLRPLGIKPGRCEFCTIGPHSKSRKRKETQFGCPKCMKRLCPVGCWTNFHAKHLPRSDM